MLFVPTFFCLALDPEDFLLCSLLNVYSFMSYVNFIICFELIFACLLSVLFFFFAYGYLIAPPAPFVEKDILPLLNRFLIFVKNQLGIFVWVYFWVLYSVLFSYVSIPSPIPHCLNYGSSGNPSNTSFDYCSSIVSLSVR